MERGGREEIGEGKQRERRGEEGGGEKTRGREEVRQRGGNI